ncbi:UvrD-helicase domain-containing protein [Lentibacillus sediminis]|uniref:UvrD-helicase domain-containing protein n=1 Tax=Lentibacillus sediminis TaxID=1940529 RepID=UPI000C1C4FCA|nr:ATP-dependent helicase [Lentibacillus sediminis]
MITNRSWKPSAGITLESAAEKAVKSSKNTLVIAGPGAGKTELLAQRASYLLETGQCKNPQKILAISFKVDAADNLQKRVEKRVGKKLARRFESKTFDSFAKSILDRFRLVLPEEYQPNLDYKLVFQNRVLMDIAKGYVKDKNPAHPNWQYEIEGKRLTQFLTKNQLPLVEEPGSLYNWVTNRMWKIMIKGFLSLDSSLTFPMISRLAEYIIKQNHYIKSALDMTYSHVFLDEFQDTTYVQYDILKTIFLESNSILTAVGDDKQRIMGWAGAMANSFEDFLSDFNAQSYQLVINHRSAPKLIEVQNILSRAINDKAVKVKCTDKWDEDDGLCEVWTFQDYKQEAKYIAQYIEEKLNTLNPRDICIIVKQQEDIYAKLLINEFKKVGIQSRIEKEFQELLSQEYVQLIMNVLHVAAFKNSSSRWQEIIIFLSEINGVDPNGDIEEMWRMEEELGGFIKQIRVNMHEHNEDNVQKEIPKMLDEIVGYFGLINLKTRYPKYSVGDLLKITRDNFHEKITESFINYGRWDKTILDFMGEFSIPVMTIHKSKGLEYECVFFIGLEDNAFWSFTSQSDSDMRAFFVALSRAKTEVYFTFSEIREIKKFGSLQTLIQSRTVISSLYELLVAADVKTRHIE